MRKASETFETWVTEAVAPIAREHGLAGKGPTFRRREGDNWVLFFLERRRLDPAEAQASKDDPTVEFRMDVGISVTSAQPTWRPSRGRPPGMHDITMYTTNRSLDSPAGAFWHAFRADDPPSWLTLTALIADGLGPALKGLGETSTKAILARRLSVTGPLENLSPGEAEELLAMADAAGDSAVRADIVAALQRDRVPDPIDALRGGWVPPIGRIDPPMRHGRQSQRQLERLLGELRSDRVYARRLAASMLAGWDSTPEVLAALRDALDHPDPPTRGFAALSLGHLGDPEDETWRRVVALADDREAGTWEIGAALVLMARLDPDGRRAEGQLALDRLTVLDPPWSQNLRAFKKQITAGE